VTGETEGTTVSLTGVLSGTEGIGTLATGTVTSTDNQAASSSPSGIFYAPVGPDATVTVDIHAASTGPAGGQVQLELSYQTQICNFGESGFSSSSSQ
jgi:hypothetical protein